jgi:hypothetical protein
MKFKFYIHHTWDNNFKQIALNPGMFLVHNKISHNIRLMVLSVSFLIWDLGLTIKWEK